MGYYLEAKVYSSNISDGRTNVKLIGNSREIEFSIPLAVQLSRRDKFHFLIRKDPQEPVSRITHHDYKDVEITRKDEKNYFLRLYARDMRLLDSVKKDYQE